MRQPAALEQSSGTSNRQGLSTKFEISLAINGCACLGWHSPDCAAPLSIAGARTSASQGTERRRAKS